MPEFRVVRMRVEVVEYWATVEARDELEAGERFDEMWESASLDIHREAVRADMTDQVVLRIPEPEDEEGQDGTPV